MKSQQTRLELETIVFLIEQMQYISRHNDYPYMVINDEHAYHNQKYASLPVVLDDNYRHHKKEYRVQQVCQSNQSTQGRKDCTFAKNALCQQLSFQNKRKQNKTKQKC